MLRLEALRLRRSILSFTSAFLLLASSASGAAPMAPFDPTGKTFFDLVMEARRAFQNEDYDREILIMDYAVTMELPPQQTAVALFNRGSAYMAKDDLERALRDFDAGMRFQPRDAEAYRMRGLALYRSGRTDEAQRDFAQALELNPKLWSAYLGRAFAFRADHQLTRALQEFDKAIELNPKSPGVWADRAAIDLQLNKNEEALRDANKALELDKTYQLGHMNRANAFIRLKKYDQAQRDLDTVVLLNPKDPARGLNGVAWLKATCEDPKMRNGKEAVELATKACETKSWKDPKCLDTLAAAQAEAGDFDAAVKSEESALAIARKHPVLALPGYEKRLVLYQKHEAYRDPFDPGG